MKIGDEVIINASSSVFAGRKGVIMGPMVGYYKRWVVILSATPLMAKSTLGFRESMLELSRKSPRQKTFEFRD